MNLFKGWNETGLSQNKPSFIATISRYGAWGEIRFKEWIIIINLLNA